MSTVVGIVKDKTIWMGADSFATTENGDRRRIICRKIFTNGPYLIGYIGSVRTGQVVKPEFFKAPKRVQDFPDELRKQFEEKGCLAVNSETQCVGHESNFLIGTASGQLFEILVDFQMNEIADFTAIGSGASYALGSLYTTSKVKDQKLRILTALKAAATYDTSTGPPFITEQFFE